MTLTLSIISVAREAQLGKFPGGPNGVNIIHDHGNRSCRRRQWRICMTYHHVTRMSYSPSRVWAWASDVSSLSRSKKDFHKRIYSLESSSGNILADRLHNSRRHSCPSWSSAKNVSYLGQQGLCMWIRNWTQNC